MHYIRVISQWKAALNALNAKKQISIRYRKNKNKILCVNTGGYVKLFIRFNTEISITLGRLFWTERLKLYARACK